MSIKGEFFLKLKDLSLKKEEPKDMFGETHVRMTTYVEKHLRQKMELLKDEGEIRSFARLVNVALQHFMSEHL